MVTSLGGYLPQLGIEMPYPGMLPPPPSDPQIVSLRERLPDVDHAVTDRILKGAFTAAELPLLLPGDARSQLRAWQTRLQGTGVAMSTNRGKDDPDFPPFGHLATAFCTYTAVLGFFLPPGIIGRPGLKHVQIPSPSDAIQRDVQIASGVVIPRAFS